MKKLCVLIAILAMIGCAPAAAEPSPTTEPAAQTISLNESAELHIGGTVSIAETDIVIVFTGISEDSRCPQDVACVWAGQVTATFDVTSLGETSQITLTLPGTESLNVRDYTLTLEAVNPYPVSTVSVPAQDITAVIRVTN